MLFLQPDLVGGPVKNVGEQVTQNVLGDLFGWRLANPVGPQMRLAAGEEPRPCGT